ncbi:XRE family transcriptional regulator [Nocardiopsis sp. CNT312]|uniref:XRE family transcriptional regulator n=1 Tax=Nocardiopsis sp. CNT312 TaxID=1137268 RepID=UPI0012DD5235|nr:XRE family transcriptional regulator [Nocardiopsis sp. CNT312]
MVQAVDARDARQVLRLLSRHAPDLTHEALANMCQVSQSTITRAISGQGLTRASTVHTVLTSLGAPIPRPPAAPRNPTRTERGAPRSEEGELDRTLARDAHRTLRQTRAVLAKAMHEPALDLLEADIGRLARHYVSHPLADLYTEIKSLRDDTFALVETTSHPDQIRRLHIAAARLAGLQAHVCLDLGQYAHADTNADAAWALATSVHEPGLRAWVRSLHSLIAYWDGRYRDARHAAEDGLTHRVTDSNLARLHALRARACAAQGDHRQALAAIGAAHEHSRQHLLPGVFGFPEAKVHAYASSSLLMFATPRDRHRSVEHAHRAIRLYTEASALDRSFGDLLAARLDLASAHIHAREPDAALEQVQVITAAPPQHRTASITQRAQRLARLVTATTDAEAARRIHAHVTEFCRHPGPLAARAPVAAR